MPALETKENPHVNIKQSLRMKRSWSRAEYGALVAGKRSGRESPYKNTRQRRNIPQYINLSSSNMKRNFRFEFVNFLKKPCVRLKVLEVNKKRWPFLCAAQCDLQSNKWVFCIISPIWNYLSTFWIDFGRCWNYFMVSGRGVYEINWILHAVAKLGRQIDNFQSHRDDLDDLD